MHADIKPRHRILVVEKEIELIDLIAEILRRAGYQVLAANNSGDALLLCADADQCIELVICGFNMPGLNGIQLARTLWTTAPGIEFIVISGNPAALDDVRAAGVACIEKPFSPSELLAAIHERVGAAR